jgi:hypothetical protein
MVKKFLIPVSLTLVLLIALTSIAHAAPPNGVDHLRGRWRGTLQNFFGANQSFTLLLGESQPDPNDSQAALYNGCISVGANGQYTPVSARVVLLGNEEYDLTLYGTANGSVIKLTGLIEARGASVKDDTVSGEWQNSEGSDNWSAIHHDRRTPKCPAVEIGNELYFYSSVNAVVNIRPDESRFEQNILDGGSNIVSSGMQVELPNGEFIVVPFYTDLFSPTADFINEFRFLEVYANLPVVGEAYTFTLLDIFGNPISGTTQTDVWYACTMDAPRNVTALLDADGLHLTWDAVTPAAGFDPTNQIGFYQIELYPDGGGGFGYGSNLISSTAHLIPFDSFGGGASGTPDGNDFGASLSELNDGFYLLDVISFSNGFNPDSTGLECQIRANAEQIYFEKFGDTITLLP